MGVEIETAVKSADRILEMFEVLARGAEGMTHQALADALNIPKSSLTKLLQTAISRGFIAYSPADRRYTLGERFSLIAQSLLRAPDLAALSIPVLEDITARTRESSAMNVLHDRQAEVVATVSGPQRLVTHMRLGEVAPLYATSGGKVILAHLPDAEREQYLRSISFEAITDRTICDLDRLHRELDTIRHDGIAYSFEEFTPGIVGMARAVLAEDGAVLGSLNVAMPAVRYSEEMKALVAGTLAQSCNALASRLRL